MDRRLAGAARTTTRSCSPTATGATWWTVTATGASRRSSPTSTPAGTASTSRSRTGSTTSTSAPWSATPTRSSPPRCTSSAAAAGTGAAPWSLTAINTCGTIRRSRSSSTGRAAHDLPVIGIDNLPGARAAGAARLPRRCVLLFGQEGPGLSEPARKACAAVCSIAQFGSTRSINAGVASGIAMHAWIRAYADQHPRYRTHLPSGTCWASQSAVPVVAARCGHRTSCTPNGGAMRTAVGARRCTWREHIGPEIVSQRRRDWSPRRTAPATGAMPLWCPWPLPTGWTVTGVGWVGDDRSGVRATAVACSGPARSSTARPTA